MGNNYNKKDKETQSNIIKAVLHPREHWALRGRIGGHVLKWSL